jgi:tRNA (cytidine/uridine-2'-O-)-methyltransferase
MRLILYQPDMPGNLGAIMRLCACFAIKCEIVEPCGFPLATKALKRAAMDYGAPSEIVRHISFDALLETLDGARLVLATTKGATALHDFNFLPDDALIFGRESAGAPGFVHEAASGRVIIPMTPGARSLNLASSASITLFEALRQTEAL